MGAAKKAAGTVRFRWLDEPPWKERAAGRVRDFEVGARLAPCAQNARRNWKRNVRPSFSVFVIWPKFGDVSAVPGSAN